MIAGYNIALNFNGKTLLGRTQDDLSISAIEKESLTKDDQGNKQTAITGHDVAFSCSGLISFNTSSGASTTLDRDDIIQLALKKGAEAVTPFTYTCDGGDTYSGNLVITGYTESSNAEDNATYSLNCKVTGALTKKTS